MEKAFLKAEVDKLPIFFERRADQRGLDFEAGSDIMYAAVCGVTTMAVSCQE